MIWRIVLAGTLVLGTLSVDGSSPAVVGTRQGPMVVADRSVPVNTESTTRASLAPPGPTATSELAADQSAATEPDSQASFRWPVDDPAIIVRRFDLPAQPWLAGHRGVDLAAPPGSPIFAPANGVVTFVGQVVDRHLIVIDHGELRSTLEPVYASVALGQAVAAGQQLGVVSGEPAHALDVVHWGVRRGDVYIDPTLLVNPRPRAILLE